MSDVIRLATESYVNQEIPTKVSELENDVGYSGYFIAEYGVTTVKELCDAYRAGKKLVCVINKGGAAEKYADLTYINGADEIIEFNKNSGIFVFSHTINNVYTRYYYHNGWNTDDYDIADNDIYSFKKIDEANRKINTIESVVQNLPIKTNMAYWIEPNAKYYLSQPGLYIFAGNDYDLKLCDESGNTIGQDKSLNITIVRTENNPSFVLTNYKNSLMSSINSAVTSLTDKCYVHNTNTTARALVFRLTNG